MDGGRLDLLLPRVALVGFAGWTVARVSGEDPLAFLHATLSQDLGELGSSRGALACLLTDKGRVQAEVRVLVLADGSVLLDGEPACLPPLVGWLARVAPLSGCEVVDESAQWSLLGVRGPGADDAVPAVPEALEHAVATDAGTLVVRVAWGVPGLDVLAPAGAAPAVGGERVTGEAFEAARIAGGRPRYGIDITDELHIAETPLLQRAVSFTKGCYPGQESVARLHLGRPRRRLVGLDIPGGDPPPAGTGVEAEGTSVGHVTSAAAVGDGSSAIAVVAASVEDGAVVVAGGAEATVGAL